MFTPLYPGSYRKGNDRCGILPYRGYACRCHDEGTDVRKTCERHERLLRLMGVVLCEETATVGNNSGAFYTFLLHKLSHVYIDLITPIISTIFSPHYTFLQQLRHHELGKLNATAWKLRAGAKNYAIPMATPVPELLILAIPIAIWLRPAL